MCVCVCYVCIIERCGVCSVGADEVFLCGRDTSWRRPATHRRWSVRPGRSQLLLLRPAGSERGAALLISSSPLSSSLSTRRQLACCLNSFASSSSLPSQCCSGSPSPAARPSSLLHPCPRRRGLRDPRSASKLLRRETSPAMQFPRASSGVSLARLCHSFVHPQNCRLRRP